MWTKETIIYARRLTQITSDLEEPISYVLDGYGNKLLCDGNHRAYIAFLEGREPNGIQIGIIEGDISNDPWLRKVEELRVVDFDPPQF